MVIASCPITIKHTRKSKLHQRSIWYECASGELQNCDICTLSPSILAHFSPRKVRSQPWPHCFAPALALISQRQDIPRMHCPRVIMLIIAQQPMVFQESWCAYRRGPIWLQGGGTNRLRAEIKSRQGTLLDPIPWPSTIAKPLLPKLAISRAHTRGHVTTLLSRHGCQPASRRPIGLKVLAGEATVLTLTDGYVLKTEWLHPWAEQTGRRENTLSLTLRYSQPFCGFGFNAFKNKSGQTVLSGV